MKKLLLLFLLTSCATPVISPKSQLEEHLRFMPEIQIAKLTGEKPYKEFDSKVLLVEEENPNDQRTKRILPLIEKGYCPVAKIVFDYEQPQGRYNAFTHASSVPFKRGKLTAEELKQISKKVNSELVVGASYEMPKGLRWSLKKTNHRGEPFIRFELESFVGERTTRYEIFFLNKREDFSVKTDCDFYSSIL